MSPSRRSSVSSTSSDSPRSHYYDFIVHKLLSYNSLPLTHLINQLSALPSNVQAAVGTSKFAVRGFLEQYPDVFKIDERRNVSLWNYENAKQVLESKRDPSCDSKVGNKRVKNLPAEINDGRGAVYRLFSTFGFISVFKPVKTTLYFSTLNYNRDGRSLMSDCGFEVGQILGFNAIRGPVECDAKYKASKVWFVDDDEDYDPENEDDCSSVRSFSSMGSSNYSHGQSRNKTRSRNSKLIQNKINSLSFVPQAKMGPSKGTTGKNSRVKMPVPSKRDSLSRKDKAAFTSNKNLAAHRDHDGSYEFEDCRAEGIVDNIFDSHGFLVIKMEKNERVFFHLRDIVDKKITSSLTKVLKKGDTVLFEAIESDKPTEKVKWVATKIWLKKLKDFNQSVRRDSPAVSSLKDWEHKESVKKLSKAAEPVPVEDINPNALCLMDYRGKICYPPSDEILIKCGPNDRHQIMVDLSAVYVNSSKVVDIKWEIMDGDIVNFDAVRKNKNSDWMTTLLWIGMKPKVPEKVVSEKPKEEPVPKTKIMTAPANWADCPYSEEEEEELHEKAVGVASSNVTNDPIVQKTGDVEVYMSDDESSNEDDDSNVVSVYDNQSGNEDVSLQKEIRPEPDKDLVTVDKTCLSINGSFSDSDEDYKECSEDHDEEQLSGAEDVAEVCDKKVDETSNTLTSSVTFFDNIQGKASRVSRSYVEVKCQELEKAVAFFRSDFYLNGVLVSENYTHMSEVLSLGDTVNLNCFRIIDDQGRCWHKPTIIWTGIKPDDVLDMEPAEFIESQSLSVSCKILSWKNFRAESATKVCSINRTPAIQHPEKQSTKESMGLLNNLSISSNKRLNKVEGTAHYNAKPCAAVRDSGDMSSSPTQFQNKIEETSAYLFRKIEMLQKRCKQKEISKGLQDLHMAIQSYQEFIMGETTGYVQASKMQMNNIPISNAPQIMEGRASEKKTVSSQTIITGNVVSGAVYHDIF